MITDSCLQYLSLYTLLSSTKLTNNSEGIICNIHNHTYSQICHQMIPAGSLIALSLITVPIKTSEKQKCLHLDDNITSYFKDN